MTVARRPLEALAAVVVALVLAAPAGASERHPTIAELEREVMCPTCNTLLEVSDAPVADRMRTFIRSRIAAGDSKTEIKATLVAEFGTGILAAPPARGFGLLAWLLPLAGLLGAGAAVAAVAWRWRHASDPELAPAMPSSNGSTQLDPALQRRLERELARFDR
jgi:cytochrome c-type biogenesis protein CcmH